MFGFSDEILSHGDSEFMSDLTEIFSRECQVFQLKTSAYHPQISVCVERFNRTLKDMLQAVGEQFSGPWDELLPWVLVAYRVVTEQGLGFAAFDLTFGRDVNGPLQLIERSWLKDDIVNDLTKSNFTDSVLDLRDRI